jgi:hypothetical protein
MRTKNLNKALVERVTLLCILCISLLVYSSCKTIKQTSTTKAEVKTVANLDVKQSNKIKQAVDSNVVVVDKGVSTIYTDEVITITNLSKPDSTGKQWTTQTTVTKRTISNKHAADLNKKTTVNKQNSNNTALRDKSKYKSDDKSLLATTKETKCPAWVYVVGFFSLLVAIIGIYTLLKRFGVIK